MKPRDRKFLGVWVVGMALAAVMVLIGGFVPTPSQAQAQAAAKVQKAEKVAVAKVAEAAKTATAKVLTEAKLAAVIAQTQSPASVPSIVATTAIPVIETKTATPATASPAFSVSMLLDWLLKLAGIALATMIPLLLQRWLGGKVSAEQLAVYSKLAVDAVVHTEELAHQAVKSGTQTLDSNAKANAAVAYVLQAADALRLRPMAESAVKNLIDAKLGESRAAPKIPAGAA